MNKAPRRYCSASNVPTCRVGVGAAVGAAEASAARAAAVVAAAVLTALPTAVRTDADRLGGKVQLPPTSV